MLGWQVEQSADVVTWVAPLVFGVTPWYAVPLWQVAQPVVMPVWFIAVPENTEVLRWQVPQSCVPEFGTWLLAHVTGVTFWYVWPPWQLAQVPLTAACPVVPIVAPAKVVRPVWQVTQSDAVVKWVDPLETGVVP